MTTNLQLTAQDIVRLLLEMPIEKGDLRICSNSSFLSIIALLELTMNEDGKDQRKHKEGAL